MWELRQTRDQRRALVGFAAGGDVAVTAEGQEIRGAVVGGAEPRQGQPVLVTGTAGNWTISGLELEPFAADTPLSTPQLYDRKGCGKCWTLAEFGSDIYLRREFRTLYVSGVRDENGQSIPTVRYVNGRLESVKYPRYGIHWLWFGVISDEPCLVMERPTGLWLEGRLAAPLPDGAVTHALVRFFLPDVEQPRDHTPNLVVDGDRIRVAWTGVPHEGSPGPGPWSEILKTGFFLGFILPLDADTLAITELEVCLGSQGRARVTSEQ